MAITREAAPASRAAAPSEALYDKLRPGPGMSAQEVASHQCARIHGAMIELAGEEGYAAVTVRDLANLAGVSTRTFYRHFRDKDECILRTYELVVQRTAARIAAAQSGERDWLARMRRAFAAFAREIANKPRAARLALLEPYAVGATVLERAARTDSLFEAMIAESFARAPDRVEVPSLVIKGIVGGIARVARARLLSGKEQELPGLADELLRWALTYRDGAVSQLDALDRRSSQTDSPTSPAEPTEARPEKGRSVREDDRTLILTAVAKLAASEGYRYLTIPRIRTAAGVSRRSFNAHFEGVDDCFLSALELRTAEALESAAAQAAGNGWPGDVHRTIAALCTRVAFDPQLAKLAFIEVVETGPAGMRCREGIVRTTAEFFTANAPGSQRQDELAVEASMGAVWAVFHHYVTFGRAQELPRIAATLSYLALAPVVGARTATETIQREQARF